MIKNKSISNFVYAGFWRRLAAALIDILLILIVIYGLLFSLEFLKVTSVDIVIILFGLFVILFPWIYFASMESSAKQATLGKLALSIKVTDIKGNKIDFGKASRRYWAKIIPFVLVYITRPVPSDIIGTIAISILTTIIHPFVSFEGRPITTILTLIPFIWFGSIAFTAQKQAPHDMIAKCLVLMK